jgi:hypothetical protein
MKNGNIFIFGYSKGLFKNVNFKKNSIFDYNFKIPFLTSHLKNEIVDRIEMKSIEMVI